MNGTYEELVVGDMADKTKQNRVECVSTVLQRKKCAIGTSALFSLKISRLLMKPNVKQFSQHPNELLSLF